MNNLKQDGYAPSPVLGTLIKNPRPTGEERGFVGKPKLQIQTIRIG